MRWLGFLLFRNRCFIQTKLFHFSPWFLNASVLCVNKQYPHRYVEIIAFRVIAQSAAIYLSISMAVFTNVHINNRYRAFRGYSIVCGITNLCTGRQTEVLFLSGASVAPVIRALYPKVIKVPESAFITLGVVGFIFVS